MSAQDPVSGQTTVYYVPVYEYASTATVPDENTDVYFKCDDFSMGSDSAGYRYRIAGSISLGADTTVKSINIQRTDDNWMMFWTNGHDLTILEDVVYNSNAVALIGSSSSTNIKVGGNVRVLGSGGLSRYNAFRLGADGVGSIKIGGDIIFEKRTRMQLVTAGNASAFDNPQSVVSGIADFSGYAARLDLGRRSGAIEQFYSFGGLSGSNSDAVISTDAEAGSNGLISTVVLSNVSDAVFRRKDYKSHGARRRFVRRSYQYGKCRDERQRGADTFRRQRFQGLCDGSKRHAAFAHGKRGIAWQAHAERRKVRGGGQCRIRLRRVERGLDRVF